MIDANERPNFRIVEYTAPDVDYEEFKKDFCNCFMTISEIREKHGLSNSEFNEYRRRVLDDTGLSRKPTYTYRPTQFFTGDTTIRSTTGEFIQEKSNGFIVIKTTLGHTKYYGRYHSYEVACMVRDKLVESDWNEHLGAMLKDKYGAKRGDVKPALEKAKIIYDEFKDLYFNSDLKVMEIKEKLGISHRTYKYLIDLIREELGNPNYRRVARHD